MKFSEICTILGCPTNVVAGERDIPANALTCEEVEAAMFLALMENDAYLDECDPDAYLDAAEYWADF